MWAKLDEKYAQNSVKKLDTQKNGGILLGVLLLGIFHLTWICQLLNSQIHDFCLYFQNLNSGTQGQGGNSIIFVYPSNGIFAVEYFFFFAFAIVLLSSPFFYLAVILNFMISLHRAGIIWTSYSPHSPANRQTLRKWWLMRRARAGRRCAEGTGMRTWLEHTLSSRSPRLVMGTGINCPNFS